LLIPCHRVVPKSGGLGSFTPDPRIKEQLIHFEVVTDLI
jgi:O6-methylguanine-DNA--protein-cysteine methyltransferase